MNEYTGTAEILDHDGAVFDTVRVSLRSQAAGSWGGRVETTTFEGGPWEHIARIRLEDGSEGEVTMTERVKQLADGSGHVRDAWIEGVGDPPF